jgi:hypothetical protein
MAVGSAMFPHKDRHKVTWKSPDGNTTNQIDHILTDLHHKSNLQDTRSYRGTNMDSDHFLTIVKLRNRINKYYKKQRGNVQNRYDIEKLQDSEIAIKYRDILNKQLEGDEHVTELSNGNWTVCKQVITKTAEEIIKEKDKRKRKECEGITQRKNSAHKEMIQKQYTKDAVEKYRELRREKNT